MAKFTALLLAAAVLVLSITLLVLAVFQRPRGEAPPDKGTAALAGAAARAGFTPLHKLQEGVRLPQSPPSIPAFRRPCTPPAGFWAAPGLASSAPFSNDRPPALRQNNSAQPHAQAKQARLKPLATACGIQNEAGLASLQFASMSPTVEESRSEHSARQSQGGAIEQENSSRRDSGRSRRSWHPGGARRPLRRKREIGRAHRAIPRTDMPKQTSSPRSMPSKRSSPWNSSGCTARRSPL